MIDLPIKVIVIVRSKATTRTQRLPRVRVGLKQSTDALQVTGGALRGRRRPVVTLQADRHRRQVLSSRQVSFRNALMTIQAGNA